MKVMIPAMPEIREEDLTPLVRALVEIIKLQQAQIQELKDETARLKGINERPKIQPSRLEPPAGTEKSKKDGKRAGSSKRMKTVELEIHQVVELGVEDVPSGSVFKGFKDYTVQDIRFEPFNTQYRRARWQLPDGSYATAPLPAEVKGGHFGTTLVCFILYQYHHAQVTQPLLLQLLRELGVDISAGELNNIITEGKQSFVDEKDEILRVGLAVSSYVHVDDTKARHKGQNGYCTHIGNELFTFFASTSSKSRINFLSLLRAGAQDYVLCDFALLYMREQGLPAGSLAKLSDHEGECFKDLEEWNALLATLDISRPRDVRLATEGALLGSALEHGVHPDLVVVSDDAGQFNVLRHALCWIHAERTIARLIGFTSPDREALEAIRTEVWEFYRALKAFRDAPSEASALVLNKRFDTIFTQKTCYVSLNLALARLHRNKSELLLVLEYPDTPLHNNLSEQDLREYVKRRKISGSTRSEAGRECRDTFASLKKTARKLGVSFWDYLKDRVSGAMTIELLSDLIAQRAGPAPA